MERSYFDESNERLITPEEKERLQRALASYGLVDATLFDMPEDIPHPNDRKWAVYTEKENPNVIKGLE